MKKIAGYILTATFAAMYVLSTMGYGIHFCEHDGTSCIMLLYGESPCEHSHHNSINCSTHHSNATYEDGCSCCSTNYCGPECSSHNTGCACHCTKCCNAGCNAACPYKHTSRCCHTIVLKASSEQLTSHFNADFREWDSGKHSYPRSWNYRYISSCAHGFFLSQSGHPFLIHASEALLCSHHANGKGNPASLHSAGHIEWSDSVTEQSPLHILNSQLLI